MEYIILFCSIIGFFAVLVGTSKLIRYLKKIDLVVKDMNKKDKPLVPASGGLAVMSGLFVGLMLLVFIRTFFDKDGSPLLPIFAALTSILMISFIGFIDDLVIRKTKDRSSGLKQWQKPLLTLVAAVPLVVISVGETIMTVPFLGRIDFGLIYPLVLIPIGIVFAANMVNLLAGFNGLETGMGVVYTGMLGLYAYVNNREIAATIAFITFASLLAFYYYNKYPAKIFAGDSLTYLLGTVLACIAILGNMERAVLIVSIPFIVEFFLKLRSRFKAQCYGYYEDGKIKSMYDRKIYSIAHIFTRTGKYSEKQIVYFIILIELIFSSLIWI